MNLNETKNLERVRSIFSGLAEHVPVLPGYAAGSVYADNVAAAAKAVLDRLPAPSSIVSGQQTTMLPQQAFAAELAKEKLPKMSGGELDHLRHFMEALRQDYTRSRGSAQRHMIRGMEAAIDYLQDNDRCPPDSPLRHPKLPPGGYGVP